MALRSTREDDVLHLCSHKMDKRLQPQWRCESGDSVLSSSGAGWSGLPGWSETSGGEDVAVVRCGVLIAVSLCLSGWGGGVGTPPGPESETSSPLVRGKVAKQPPLLLTAFIQFGGKKGGKK